MRIAARFTNLIFALMLLGFAAGGASAWTVNQVDFSGQAGTGSNVSYCVVDFDSASYAFKYFWDGAQTGFNMLQTLQSDVNGFNFSYENTSYGPFVVGFSYGGNSLTGDGSVAPDYMYWGYEISSDGQTFDMASTGADGRDLSNGSWDAWKWMSASDSSTPQPSIPGVPEPSGALALFSGLIGLAGLLKAARRR